MSPQGRVPATDGGVMSGDRPDVAARARLARDRRRPAKPSDLQMGVDGAFESLAAFRGFGVSGDGLAAAPLRPRPMSWAPRPSLSRLRMRFVPADRMNVVVGRLRGLCSSMLSLIAWLILSGLFTVARILSAGKRSFVICSFLVNLPQRANS